MTSVIRWLLGEQSPPEAVRFSRDAPSDVTRYFNFFRCPVSFNHAFDGIATNAADLNRPLPDTSFAVRRQMEHYLCPAGAFTAASFDSRVDRIIRLILPHGEARAEIVARHLSTTPRALNRSLAELRTNFSALLDTARRNVATQALKVSDHSISDIACLVGFGSLSTFSSWFKLSFGCSPRA